MRNFSREFLSPLLWIFGFGKECLSSFKDNNRTHGQHICFLSLLPFFFFVLFAKFFCSSLVALAKKSAHFDQRHVYVWSWRIAPRKDESRHYCSSGFCVSCCRAKLPFLPRVVVRFLQKLFFVFLKNKKTGCGNSVQRCAGSEEATQRSY
jgi:hypothetical protein